MGRYKFITIKVFTNDYYNDLYIVGNTKNLGNWDPNNAFIMKKGEDCYYITKRFEIGMDVEFKFIKNKSWNNVEKGIWKEEISNHHLKVENQKETYITIYNFQ